MKLNELRRRNREEEKNVGSNNFQQVRYDGSAYNYIHTHSDLNRRA